MEDIALDHLHEATMTHLSKLAIATATVTLMCWSGIVGCGGGDGAGAGGDGNAGSGASTGDGGGFVGSGGSGSGGFDACASAAVEGDRIPVQMYIMFDKSGSMLDDQKWAGATAALTAFFQDDDSAGLNVALRFFPDDAPVAGCNENACNANACATPLVEVGELNALPAHSDPHQAALVEAVQSKSPGGQTPMYAALAGATSWATSIASEDLRTAVVIVTDGEPNGCNEDTVAIAQLAADAFAGSDVITYAIGMQGADIAQLDQIAQAGGSSDAFVIGQGSVNKDLVAAFESIGTEAIACTMALPESAVVGEEVEPSEVNVAYTPGGSDNSEAIGQVPSAAECGGGGWFYDDPSDPLTIELCPSTCDEIQGDPNAKLEIVLGCKTVLK
jgi:von Willebrand factor type A domain